MTMDGPTGQIGVVSRSAIVMLDEDDDDAFVQADPGVVVLTCANCGAQMDERKCKLICRCGYFLSCSDYY
jgi:hypothetical protein